MMVAAASIKIPAKWRKLFKLIPGYDPICMRQPGDWFDADAAQHVCDYYPAMLKHVEGVKGTPSGTPFTLNPWQQAVWGCLFGFKGADNLRCYRTVFLYLPKKMGKTAWCAGLIPYMLTDSTMAQNGRRLFSAASTFEQAAIIFAHASGMVRQNPAFKGLKIVGEGGGGVKKAIVNRRKMSSYRCLAANADAADGEQPDWLFVDELHHHPNDTLMTFLIDGTSARPEPIVLIATTADYNRPSACNDMLKRARYVRDNGGKRGKPGDDSTFLPIIYEASNDDDWTDEKVWAEVNPNLGTTKTLEWMRTRCKEAQDIPSKQNSFKRLHLNIVTDSDVAFFDMAKWDACGGEIDLESLRGQRCFAGCDLASTKDVTALVLWFPEPKVCLCWFWLPEETARDRERKAGVPYSEWARKGHITLTPGNVTDYEYIRNKINELHALYGIQVLGMDPANATHLLTELKEHDGINVEEFIQGWRSMNPPTKELERLVVSGQINHGGNPVLRWMAGNTMVKLGPNENARPDKEKSTEKIDGIVALVEAIGVAMVAPGVGVSCYETEELTVL